MFRAHLFNEGFFWLQRDERVRPTQRYHHGNSKQCMQLLGAAHSNYRYKHMRHNWATTYNFVIAFI